MIYGTDNARIGLASRPQTWVLARYAYTAGTLGAAVSPVPTVVWQIPGPHCVSALEGTCRWNAPH